MSSSSRRTRRGESRRPEQVAETLRQVITEALLRKVVIRGSASSP